MTLCLCLSESRLSSCSEKALTPRMPVGQSLHDFLCFAHHETRSATLMKILIAADKESGPSLLGEVHEVVVLRIAGDRRQSFTRGIVDESGYQLHCVYEVGGFLLG